jgi:hypothetical protein
MTIYNETKEISNSKTRQKTKTLDGKKVVFFLHKREK